MQSFSKTLFALGAMLVIGVTGAFAQNYKIKQTVSTNGQSMTNTTYVRGPRKRTENGGIMGMGGDVANIEQCDLKQNVKVSDKKKMYTVEPFDTGETPAAPSTRTTAPKTKTTKGGTVTYTSNITDTGERKPMFGLTARHLKTSMTMEASPDACNKSNMNISTDGWYIDLPEFSCPVNISGSVPRYDAQPSGGCQDHVVMKSTGGGKLGFPLSETRTISMEGGMEFTQTTETVEFSKAVLEPTLFDIPAGYTLASNANDLYSRPDISAIMQAQQAEREPNTNTGSTGSTPAPDPGVSTFTGTKIGVIVPNNRGDDVSTAALQSFLVQRLTSGNVMAVAVASDAEARSMKLDYVLATDITKLKQSTGSKIGGMFGKVAGVPTGGNFEAQVEYKLIKLADGKMALQSKSSSKSESEANAAAQNVLGMEATAVLGAIK